MEFDREVNLLANQGVKTLLRARFRGKSSELNRIDRRFARRSLR
jgi:hypothetical protein